MRRSKKAPRIFLALCSLLLMFPLVACNSETNQLPANQLPASQLPANQSSNASTPTESFVSSDPKEESRQESSDLQSPASSETSSEEISDPNQASSTAQPAPPTQSAPPIQAPSSDTPKTPPKEDESVKSIRVTVANKTFTATLAENTATQAFVELMKVAPIVINMTDHGGFEKVGALGSDLKTSNNNTTTQPGDIVLYNTNQIVIFYGSNTWSYTRLGKIDDLSGFEEALGSGDVTVTFSIE